jgi:molecular chaperone GrpE
MPSSNTDEVSWVAGEGSAGQTLTAENASLRDRLLRALADTESMRSRSERSVNEARQYAVSQFARELLEAVDNLRRAIVATGNQAATGSADPSLLEGFQAIERMLSATLGRFGVRRIEAAGAPFDPGLHEAIMKIEDRSRSPGAVAQVMEDGYTIHDRLLRPARVIVARQTVDNTAPAASEPARRDELNAASRSAH